jgi:hypothetical protein
MRRANFLSHVMADDASKIQACKVWEEGVGIAKMNDEDMCLNYFRILCRYPDSGHSIEKNKAAIIKSKFH